MKKTILMAMFFALAGGAMAQTADTGDDPTPNASGHCPAGISICAESAPDPRESLPGLSEILDQFQKTIPQFHNTAEWSAIRENIVQNSFKGDVGRLAAFVISLNGIYPTHDNMAEWANIRQTCAEIQLHWGDADTRRLYRMLLERFTSTIPKRDNQAEWSAIRGVSDEILHRDWLDH